MKLKIFENDKLIGGAEVFALDPSMGVAQAKFHPAQDYEPMRHANVIDGDYVGDRGDILRLEMADGSAMESKAISIQDFPSLNEREVHILSISQSAFSQLFSDHPHFRDYYDLDLTDKQRAEKQRMQTAKARVRSVKAWWFLGAIFGSIASAIAFLN